MTLLNGFSRYAEQYMNNLNGDTHGFMVIILGNEQNNPNSILDGAVNISHNANTLGKGRHPTILLTQSSGAVEYTDCASAEE